MKITRMAVLLLLGTVLMLGLACHVGEEPGPDPTPPPVGGVELPGTYQYLRTWQDHEEIIIMYVWVKGGKLRVDWSLYGPGKNEKMKFIDDGEYKWIYEVDLHTAAKYLTGAAVHQVDEHLLWFAENYYGTMSEEAILSEMQAACDVDQLCSSVAVSGHETIDGQPCRKFTYSACDGATIAYWISNNGWLVQVEFIDATDYSITMKYTDIDLNPSIPYDKFDIEKVAPGAEIIDITAS